MLDDRKFRNIPQVAETHVGSKQSFLGLRQAFLSSIN